MNIVDWKKSFGEMVRNMMRSAEMEEYFSVKLSPARARLLISQHSLFVRHRRDCWSFLSANCPDLSLKQKILQHEFEEVIRDEFSDHGHLDLVMRQGTAVGLTKEEILNTEPIPSTRASLYAWGWITRNLSWIEGLAALTITEWNNDDRLLKDVGGGHATRMAKKWQEELGLTWKDIPNYSAHRQADEKHSEMFVPYLEEFARGHYVNLALKAAENSLELFKIYRGGVAREMKKIV